MTTQAIRQAEFNGQPLPILQIDDDAWLTSEDIGRCLEYNEPRKSIYDIYRRHKAELEGYSSVRKLPTDKLGPRETRVFNEEGVMIITMLSRQPRAAEFRRWAVGVLKAYRHEVLAAPPASQQKAPEMPSLVQHLADEIQRLRAEAEPAQVLVDQQEYIDLLKIKARYFEAQQAPQRVRLTADQKATIARLHAMGWSAGEIGQRIGRDKSTVGTYIRNKLDPEVRS